MASLFMDYSFVFLAITTFVIIYKCKADIQYVKIPVLIITILGTCVDITITFTVVGVITQNNLIQRFSDLYEYKCYSDDLDATILDLKSQFETILIMDSAEGVIDTLSVLILICGCMWKQETIETMAQGIHGFMFCIFDLLLITINVVMFVLPSYSTFISTYNNNSYLCFRIDANTLVPTTSFPTTSFPTTSFPTSTPTTSPLIIFPTNATTFPKQNTADAQLSPLFITIITISSLLLCAMCGYIVFKSNKNVRMKAEATDIKEAISEKQQLNVHKIVMLGSGAVGLTAIVLQFVANEFLDDSDPTIEEEYRCNICIDGNVEELFILDTAGQDEFAAMREEWIRTTEASMLVYSVTSKSTFDDIDHLYNEICRAKWDEPIVSMLVGNKCDVDDNCNDTRLVRQVSFQQGANLAKSWNIPFIETSAKTGHNVYKAFDILVRKLIKSKCH
eukprot:439629_1